VKAFQDARLVNEFVGAVPEQTIRQFIASVVPSDADRLAAEGEQAEQEGRPEEAERLFRQALEVDPGHVPSAVGLGHLAAVRGDLEEARRLLTPLRPDPEAERLLAALDVSEWERAPSNASGPLAEAQRAAAEGRFGEALARFLAEVQRGGEQGQAAREAMVKLFAVLGDDDPLTREFRRRLASALF
jgi:putative thioredoxin